GLLGMQPYRGRLIAPYDDVKGGPRGGWPVVLSYGFWKDFYASAEDIVGKQITISDVPVTVVGITPPDFRGVWPGEEMKMYAPLQFETVLAKRDVLEATGDLYGVAVIGRLKPGVSLKQANAEVAQLQQGLFAQFIPDRSFLREGVSSGELGAKWAAELRNAHVREAAVPDAGARGGGVAGVLREHRWTDDDAGGGAATGICSESGARGVGATAGEAVLDGKLCDCGRGKRVGGAGSMVRKRVAAAILSGPDDDGVSLCASGQNGLF